MIGYRRAGVEDIPRLCAIRRPDEAGGDPPDRMAAYLAGTHHPREALAPREMWIAEAEGEPVGYAAGHLSRRLGCDGELQWIYVAAGHRRRGIGRELLRRMATWFASHGAHRICVDPGDPQARLFYRRTGAAGLDRHWMVWTDIRRV